MQTTENAVQDKRGSGIEVRLWGGVGNGAENRGTG